MKKVVLSTLLLSGVFVTSAMVHLPAQFVVQYAPLPPQLSIKGVEGTVWQGSVKNLTWQRDSYGEVTWKLNPFALLSGKAEASIRFGRGSDIQVQGRGVVGYSLSGLYAENLVASLPIESVLKFAPPMPVPLELNGQVELSLRSFQYGAPYCQSAQGSVVWNTDVIGSPLTALNVGPVIAQFTCQDNQIELSGDQQSQQVTSGLTAKLDANRQYSASVWFKPESEFPNELQQQLKWLPTEPDNQGRYPFSYQGRL